MKKCKYIGDQLFLISWSYNRHYSDSRLRFPQNRSRVTDLKGAKRFCKKRKINLPPIIELI